MFGKGLEELTPGFCGASLTILDVLLGITYETQDDVGSVKPWGFLKYSHTWCETLGNVEESFTLKCSN